MKRVSDKTASLRKAFALGGFTDMSTLGEINNLDATYRQLKELKDKLTFDGVVDTTQIDKALANAINSLDNTQIKMEATVDVDTSELSRTDAILNQIESVLEEIDKIKAKPLDKDAILLIKEYGIQLDQLMIKFERLQAGQSSLGSSLARQQFKTDQPALFGRIKEATNITPKNDSNGKQIGKIAGNVAKVLIGVKSFVAFARKAVAENEKLSAAVQYATEVIAAGLKPVLDFIASLIVGFFGILSRIFKIQVGVGKSSAATASNTEKALTIASFDELDVLNSNRDGGAGVSGGYGGYLDEINKKLERVYGIIDKIREFVKEHLPGGKYNDELGVPRETQAAFNQVYGDTSIGYNVIPVVTGGEVNLINVAEIEQGAQKWSNFFARVKEGWGKLKETASKNGEAIAEANRLATDAQVTKWNEWKDKVKAKWDELKTKIFGDNNEIANSNSMLSTSALQAWETLKQGAKNKWQEIKQKIFGDNAEIAQNNLSLSEILSNAWENIKINATEKWNNLKTTISQKLEDIKSKIRGVPDALSGWASSAWWYVRNFANNIITGIESAINNVIWKINNSGVANVLNKVFGGGFYVSPIWIPRLAKGGVLDTPTIAQMGEYPGAHSNPEIAAPQSLLKETIDASNGELATVFAQGIRQIISAIDNKDLEVNIDDTTIAKSASRGNRSWQLQTGNSLF